MTMDMLFQCACQKKACFRKMEVKQRGKYVHFHVVDETPSGSEASMGITLKDAAVRVLVESLLAFLDEMDEEV